MSDTLRPSLNSRRPSAPGPTPWLAFHEPRPHLRLRLFCLPYAGGGAWLYRKWQLHLPAGVEVCAIELPGRGRRYAEGPFRRLDTAVAAISDGIARYVTGVPCAFFGHSMGALLAFELALALQSRPGTEIRAVFVSGTRAPSRRPADERTYALPEAELIEVLRDWKRTPDALLDNREVLQLTLPCVRADIELAQTYRPAPGRGRLHCPVLAFGGRDDVDVPRADLEAWAEVTRGPFSLQMFSGGHFFVVESEPELLRALSRHI